MNGLPHRIYLSGVPLTLIVSMEDSTDIIRTFPTILRILRSRANPLQAGGRASMAMEQKQPV
jgi:hypothetical protein